MFVLFAESGAPEASDSGFVGERGAVLSGAGQHLLGSELSQPEPWLDPADARTQIRAQRTL